MDNKNNLIFIIYDSIFNSVFQSQVLAPLQKIVKNNHGLKVYLISFERKIPSQEQIKKIIPENNLLNFVCKKRPPFFSRLSLYPAINQLTKLLHKIPSKKIITRGPLAGYIAIKTLKKFPPFQNLTIQARGLAAEEFRFSRQFTKQNLIKKLMFPFIYKQLEKIEREVFSQKEINIETVSDALSNYLIEKFNANKTKISVATNDIPQPICTEKRKQWREEVRKKLDIAKTTKVFCYSGSARPWQCGPETINYFKKQYTKDKSCFLLILSQDKNYFEGLAKENRLPQNKYHITSIAPKEVYKYLSACDFGLLFRKEDIINWVSRPTKMLEYKAVRLKIIHNNTIELLKN